MKKWSLAGLSPDQHWNSISRTWQDEVYNIMSYDVPGSLKNVLHESLFLSIVQYNMKNVRSKISSASGMLVVALSLL